MKKKKFKYDQKRQVRKQSEPLFAEQPTPPAVSTPVVPVTNREETIEEIFGNGATSLPKEEKRETSATKCWGAPNHKR